MVRAAVRISREARRASAFSFSGEFTLVAYFVVGGCQGSGGLEDAGPPYRGLRFGRPPRGEPANGSH